MDAGGNEKMRNGKDVQEFYNKYPFPNDKVQSVESLERHSWILKVLKEPISPESTILDVGCGTGEMSIFLANRFESIRIKVIGADFTPASLEEARNSARRLQIKNVNFLQLDITKEYLKFSNDDLNHFIFEYIFSIGVLHHIPQVELALKNIKAMMNNKTLFIASVYNKYLKSTGNAIAQKRANEKYEQSRIMDEAYHPYEHSYSRKEFRKLLEDNGFKVINEWRKIPDWIRIIIRKGGMITFLCQRK